MTWLVLDWDNGVRGAYRTRAEAVKEHSWGPVRERHAYGPGAYSYVTGYEDDTDDFFVETEEAAVRSEWNLDAWIKAGRPLGRFEEAQR